MVCVSEQELSHAAMEMFGAIGRLRSARLVGKSLAEFYMWAPEKNIEKNIFKVVQIKFLAMHINNQ